MDNSIEELQAVAPCTGVVCLLRLTEKQYDNIYMLTKDTGIQDKTNGKNSVIML